MLKVVNLTKVYKTKGGVETRALDGVNLSFPEKGMVFLLGKSGSGKSTLLNLCGGLDSPTGGEIIVKGRSSKDFTQDDFDSYRNTFIGFIFQEYNILNEFSVEDNVALALELQGKPKDKEAISALLEQVDLSGYAKRKPNTLSGGQKQRIAIARALIKNPEIIMADEPTGALDSGTGKQVFETLKKLSKDKLVLVVSHDRDFAEQYGDRIIELKDGQVLTDVSKGVKEKKTVGDGNVTVVGGNTLCVKEGKTLTDEDFQFIRTFLTERKGAMITAGETEMENFKKASRINDEGMQEVFLQTDESKRPQKQYTKEDGKFIRSRLPFRRAAKIGVSGLKTKPIRLLFTILLCIVSFTMFGLFSTLMLYDGEKTLYKSMQDSKDPYILVKKEYLVKSYSDYGEGIDLWERDGQTKLTQAEIDEQRKAFGGVGFGGIAISNTSVQNMANSGDVAELYQNVTLTFVGALRTEDGLRSNVVAGNYPTAEDEIFISEYLAQCIIKNGFSDSQAAPTTVQEVVGKRLKVSLGESQTNARTEYKIAGVFDSGYQTLLSEYDLLAETGAGANRAEKEKQAQNFEAKYEENLHGVLFVQEGLLQKIVDTKKAQLAQEQSQNALSALVDYQYRFGFGAQTSSGLYYAKASALPESFAVYGKRLPAAGETVMTYSALAQIAYNRTEEEISSRKTLVEEIKEGLEGELSAFLQAKGYPYANDLSVIPDPEAESEAYAIWDTYVARRECFGNSVNEYGGWLMGFDIPDSEFNSWYYPLYSEVFLPYIERGGEDSLKARFERTVPLAEKRLTIGENTEAVNTWIDRLRNGGYTQWIGEEEFQITYTSEEKETIAAALLREIEGESLQGRVVVWPKNGGMEMQVGQDRSFKVVGLLDVKSYESMMLLDDTTYEAMKATSEQYSGGHSFKSWEETDYVASPDACFDVAFFGYDHSQAQTEALRSFGYEYNEAHSRVVMQNAVALQVEMVNSMVTELADVFMWIGIIMAVFSALLLSNFISVSITNKKKDIGILRAVGARGVDVFKIFFAESSFIAVLCVIISLVVSVVTCNVLNTELGSMLSGVALFVFGPVSIGILWAVAIGTAVIATFLPVYLAARKKPVDSIRAL